MEGVDVITCAPGDDAGPVLHELRSSGGAPYILVHGPGTDVDADSLSSLVAALDAPMAATASPVPLTNGSPADIATYPLDAALPPVPTLASPCVAACVISRQAYLSVAFDAGGPHLDWGETLPKLGRRLAEAGWRHVGVPGIGLRWASTDALAVELDGPANSALETHRLWARTRLAPPRIVVDGACLTDDPHNGSQAVVLNVSLAMKEVRPDATVSLAAPEQYIGHLRQLTSGRGVEVIVRSDEVAGFDVAYRPYQLLDPGELRWLTSAGQRFLVSQLDMIAFSNVSYHPSPALFHAVRNLQRHTMRTADGITFISRFGLNAALAECADIDPARCFVVGCGADAEPSVGPADATVVAAAGPRFVTCTSATFWHKNRQHAIATFAAMCERHGYEGKLVIAGPEPYYGRSTTADEAKIAALGPAIAARIERVGQVDEATKWWLLAHADLVLYPSVVEGFGLVPFEAAAVGVPCLAFAGSAAAEVLASTPVLVDSWDAELWAEAAHALVASEDRRAEAVDAVRTAAASLTWVAAAERTWEAIDRVLARPSMRPVEEGGLASRVAGVRPSVARGARLAHWVNRVRSYAARRMGRQPF